MKTFFHKHKIVLIALGGVLLLGVLSGLALGGVIRMSMRERSFTTVAEAKAGELRTPDRAPSEPEQTPAPKPTPEPVKLSAEDVSHIAQVVNMRRRYIIPVCSGRSIAMNTMLWREEQPDSVETAAAWAEAGVLAEKLFGKTYTALTGSSAETARVQRFADPAHDRDTILRVTDPEGKLVLTLRASDRKLINADLLTYSEAVPSDRTKDAQEIAARLGYTTEVFSKDIGTRGPAYEGVYRFTTETDECLMFSYCGDALWQISIYPSMRAMEEGEYFLADIQSEWEAEAYPERFVETDPPSLDRSEMLNSREITAKLARLYNFLSGGHLMMATHLNATFLRDDSGAREDCWKIEGEGFSVIVSAYSRNVISMECSIPCSTLLDIPFEEMGGPEYVDAGREIGERLFTMLGTTPDGDSHGKGVVNVSVNAVYDFICCTVDVELEDGTFYELRWRNGVLEEIHYYANTRLYDNGTRGWVANNVYINSATGKMFIPNYRDWDGNLYVTRRNGK